MSSRASIEFEGFDEVISRLTKLEGDVKGTTEKALKETHKYVTKLSEEAIKPHKETGLTEKSLKRNADISWGVGVAEVPVGFSIKAGGLASIFLIYGTPRMKRDPKLYAALSGKSKKTKDEVMKIQEDIFFNELRKLGG